MLGTYETFEYRGQPWTRYAAPPADEAFIAGVDLGQSQDPTAIIVMRHTRVPLETWAVDEKKRTTRQNIEERFDVVHAEQAPAGHSLPRRRRPRAGSAEPATAPRPLSFGH